MKILLRPYWVHFTDCHHPSMYYMFLLLHTHNSEGVVFFVCVCVFRFFSFTLALLPPSAKLISLLTV